MKRIEISFNRKFVLLVLIVFLIVPVTMRPQTAPQAPQANISGVVRDSVTDQPVAGVKVSIDSLVSSAIQATTDAAGHFLLSGIESGPQRVLTEKTGYAPAKPEGRTFPGDPGVWLTAPLGKTLDNVVIHIAPVGGIAGKVVDRLGHPVPRLNVYAARFGYDVYGEHHLESATAISNVRNSVTNEEGDFRISGLDPASYYVVVQPPLSVQSTVPGEAFVSTVYYPDATDLTAAKTIDIRPGSNYRLPAVTLPSVPAGVLKIHLVDPAGATHAGAVKFVELHRKGDEGEPFALGVKPDAYGGTNIIDLGLRAPGTYELEAGWLAAAGQPQVLTATTIEIKPEGLTMDLPVPPGSSITGRAVIDQPGGAPFSVSGVQLTLLPKDGGLPIKSVSNSIGLLEFEGVPPGTYHAALNSLSADMYVVSLDASNSATPSDNIKVGTEDVRLTLQLGNTGGIVDGHVSDSKNHRAAGVTVVLVPDAPFRSNGFLYRTAITDQDGTYHLSAVAPGSYHLLAWTQLEGAQYRNPSFMAGYDRAGKAVLVKKNDKQSIDIRLEEIR